MFLGLMGDFEADDFRLLWVFGLFGLIGFDGEVASDFANSFFAELITKSRAAL